MQTYIKLTPHFLENLWKILDLFKKNLEFIQKKWFLVLKNMFIQKKKHWCLSSFFEKNMFFF